MYANMWRRFAASIIDNTIVGALAYGGFLISVTAVALFSDSATGEGNAMAFIVVFSLAWMLVIPFMYFALMEASPTQGTLGKMAVRIVVTDTKGEPIGVGRSLARTLGKVLSGFLIIGYVIAPFMKRKQALHDLLAGTLVLDKGVRESSDPSSPA